MKFKPKRDFLYGFILFIISVPLLLFSILFPIFGSGNWIENTIIFIIGFTISLWLLWAWFGTYYVITEEELVINQGPFKKKIALDKIHKIERNKMPLASVALSSESYHLLYDQWNTTIISPQNIDLFVESIEKKTNHTIIFQK